MWRIAVSEFTACTFTAFLYLTHDGTSVPECDSDLLAPCKPGILVLLSVGVREALQTMGVTAVLNETGFDMLLGYTAYCCSQDVEWSRWSSNWLPYSFELKEVSAAFSCDESSSWCRNVNGVIIANHNVSALPVLFVLGDLTSLLSIQARVSQWLTELYLYEVPVGEGPFDVPEGGIFDAYGADVEGEGD